MLRSAPSVHRPRTQVSAPPAASESAQARAVVQRATMSPADDARMLEEPLAVWLHLSWGIELG